MADRSRDPSTGRYLQHQESAKSPPAGFTTPPPGAPREVSAPLPDLSSADIASARARAEARSEERERDPGARRERLEEHAHLADQRARRPHPMQAGPGIAPPPAILGGQPAAGTEAPETPAAAETPVVETPIGVSTIESSGTGTGSPTPTGTGAGPRQPAASDSDTPSRGQPRPTPPGKAITGGFGIPSTGSEYFALDGSELRAIVLALADRLKSALETDLRFGLSVVYPQVRVSLSLTVDGRPPDQRARDGSNTEQAAGQSVLEWSRILTLSADVEDNADTPAGRIRDDFQIQQPGTRLVQAGAARMLVDSQS